MFEFPVLLGDIGGTNARFAVLPAPREVATLLPWVKTAEFPNAVAAARSALDGSAVRPRSALLALAGPVTAPVMHLTNAGFTVDAAALGAALGLDRVVLVNDFPPVAVSLVEHREARGDLARIGPALPEAAGPRLVLGPGTGLGAAALVPVGERSVVLPTEAGHVELGPIEESEFALWPTLEKVGGRVTAEAVLSGPGLFRLCRAVAGLHGATMPYAKPNDVIEAGLSGEEPAAATLDLFARLLGRFAGDLALVFSAIGGVFIAGGIAPRIRPVLERGGFRAAFENKAPFRDWVARIPTFVITHPEPAIAGLAALAGEPGRFVVPAQGWTRQAGPTDDPLPKTPIG